MHQVLASSSFRRGWVEAAPISSSVALSCLCRYYSDHWSGADHLKGCFPKERVNIGNAKESGSMTYHPEGRMTS